MDIQFVSTIKQIDEQQWNTLWPSDYPFTQYAFFNALEESKSIGHQSGWQPLYLIALNETGAADQPQLKAAMPLFIKMHSYGEYVFDWSWANAYAQAGLEYYPKLINAVPFTPSTGHRIGFSETLSAEAKQDLFSLFIDTIQTFSLKQKLSGFHSLFPEKSAVQLFGQKQHLEQKQFYRRDGYQFHWFNEHEGQLFNSFDHFLQTFSSRKRKTIRKERQKVQQQNLTIIMKEAHELDESEWDTFYHLYHHTYLKKSGSTGYLGKDFFHLIARSLPKQVLVACTYIDDEFVAAALYFRDKTTLYGRYWGSVVDIDGLHFEACYYQGIEYAIKHGLKRFDPGAQGEHKIQRGFTPIKTCSYHWLSHPGFHRAIEDFLIEETKHVDAYIKDARTYLPFKEGTEPVTPDCLII